MASADELWRHPDPASTPMWAFLRHVNDRHGLGLADYAALHRWSVDHLADFWAEVWDFVGIVAETKYEEVLPPGAAMFPRPDFMRGARLNYGENLLFPPAAPFCSAGPPPGDPSAPAVITLAETDPTAAAVLTWAALREEVRRCSTGLRAMGLRPGDVVAGLVANHAEALVAMLSAATVGAIWTSLSPDTGLSAAVDRWAQIRPRVLFADDGAVYNAKTWEGMSKLRDLAAALVPLGLETVVVVGVLSQEQNAAAAGAGAAAAVSAADMPCPAFEYASFLSAAPPPDLAPLRFEQLPPAHPLYVLYSSGTTGLPKPIVHTALGTLIQHKKEHGLHCSLSPSSRLLYYTTTSWMMWHWSVSALAVGSVVVLYSGSPFRPRGPVSLPHILAEQGVTHFGTSAAYLAALEAGRVSFPDLNLSRLEAIYSTASPLAPSTFRYVYAAFPSRVNLGSITGGTDIISLFGCPCPILPVRVGEIQCAGLGMAVKAVDPATGQEVATAEPGDLVCVRPFPSQPLTFFGEGGDDRYRAAYFERFADVAGGCGPVWHHGDFVRIPDPAVTSLVMLGRSDGVLKPSGIRFGSAEIYNILTKFFADTVSDAVCVGRRRETDLDETVCLFLVMADGQRFDGDLRDRVKAVIRSELSPRHVPGVIEECGEAGVPRTSNGKKVEVAVKQILCGIKAHTNTSVANPESLEWFRRWAEAH